MRASRHFCIVVGAACIAMFAHCGFAQTVLESQPFSDPSLLAAIFVPAPSRPENNFDRPASSDQLEVARVRREFHLPFHKPSIPKDWESFERQFAPETHKGQPTLQMVEDGMYTLNQTVYSIKLFERNVNSLLNFEWSLHELNGYDSRSRANDLDNFFDHAKLRTDFDWDAPVGIYIGVRFVIKCDSIFQFWK